MTTPIALIRAKFRALKPAMDERLTRLWAGAEAEAIGDGGITIVAAATGMSRTTIRAGRDELRRGLTARDVVRVRRAGGGRPSIEDAAPGIVGALERLVEPLTRGDVESPLRWTSKSTRRLSAELALHGFAISPQKVGQLLHARGYRLPGADRSPDRASRIVRNRQFELVNGRVEAFHARNAPAISVEIKETESAGDPDRADRAPEPAIRCGGSSIARHAGWPSLDADHEPAAFAVRAIAAWWEHLGKRTYSDARELLVITDDGALRTPARRWQAELQRFADRSGLAIAVSHLPPGTRKWSRIEHQLWCHVSDRRRGHAAVDRETLVRLIGSARTTPGLPARPGLDRDDHPSAWNYTVQPRCEQHA